MERTVAFIPVRGGSKSIPLKNIKEICGKPLIYWTAKAACEAKCVDLVYIATDSDDIRKAVLDFKVREKNLFSKIRLFDRQEENASDTASTESVMLEFAQKVDFENIILIQATSPMLESHDIEKGFDIFNEPDTDSIVSVVREKRFIWKENNDGFSEPQNYNVFDRPRRQDFDGYLIENGAFYITTKNGLLESKNRISGRIKSYIMPEETAYEIDEAIDFIIVESLMREKSKNNERKNKVPIKMVVMDLDGCLTDGGMYYSEHGDELKKFNTKDGMAVSMIHDIGIITGIITGENRELNNRRAIKMKLDFIEQGVKDKGECLMNKCEQYGIKLKNVLYIGDDINDLGAIRLAGYSACPSDAADEIINVAGYISSRKGGEGAIREILESIVGI